MKKKFLLVKLTVLFSGFSIFGHSQTVLTLKDCIEAGYNNNFDVLQKQLQAESDKANWKQSKLNIFPDLNASAGHSFNQGRSIDPYTNSPVTQSFNSSNYGVNSNVILFNGLAIQNNIRRNELTYEASSMDIQAQKDNLAMNIVKAYMKILSSIDRVEQVKKATMLSAKQVERLNIMNKEGAIKPIDFTNLKGQYAGDQLAVINAENTLETDKVDLCRLMNIPYNKDLTLEKIDPELFTAKYENGPEAIYQAAVKQLAMIKAVDLRQQSAAKGVKVAKGQLFPTLSFGAGVSTSYSSVAKQSQYVNTVYAPTSDSAIISNVKYPVYRYRDNFTAPSKISYMDQLNNNVYTSFGFSLSVPIFNALQQRNRVKQAKINYKSAELTAKTIRTALSRDIDQAYINMVSASETYKAALEQVSAFKESFHSAEIFFQQGVGTSIDYLIVKNNLDQANTNLILAKYDLILRVKILDYYQGKQVW
jgi:outer membrane protein